MPRKGNCANKDQPYCFTITLDPSINKVTVTEALDMSKILLNRVFPKHLFRKCFVLESAGQLHFHGIVIPKNDFNISMKRVYTNRYKAQDAFILFGHTLIKECYDLQGWIEYLKKSYDWYERVIVDDEILIPFRPTFESAKIYVDKEKHKRNYIKRYAKHYLHGYEYNAKFMFDSDDEVDDDIMYPDF